MSTMASSIPRPSSYPQLGPKYPLIRDHISPIKGTRRVLVDSAKSQSCQGCWGLLPAEVLSTYVGCM